MGNSLGAVKGRSKFLSLRNRPLGFSPIHDENITISDDGRTAQWGMANTNTEGEGRCYTNRTLKVNEIVRISVRGSGFFDLGLSDVHPAQLHSNKDFVFKYISSKVLFFDPVTLRLRIGRGGEVYFTDGTDPEVKLRLGAQATSHWLALKLGCGEVTVTFLEGEPCG